MNTTTATKTVMTYTVVRAMWDLNKFEVEVRQTGGFVNYLRTLTGTIRLFSTRSSARKAITRELRRVAGEPGALHR